LPALHELPKLEDQVTAQLPDQTGPEHGAAPVVGRRCQLISDASGTTSRRADSSALPQPLRLPHRRTG
jgi:hypothetical protein